MVAEIPNNETLNGTNPLPSPEEVRQKVLDLANSVPCLNCNSTNWHFISIPNYHNLGRQAVANVRCKNCKTKMQIPLEDVLK